MKKTSKVTFRTTEKIKSEISQYAKIKGISTGQLIRDWIDVFLKNQVINSPKHFYQIEDGTQFPDLKTLCAKLQISSHTARKKIKNGIIEKVTIDTTHAKKYGNEISTARSSTTETNWI